MFWLRSKIGACIAAALACLALAAPPAAAQMKCLPTCDPADGRFLAIAGSNLITLSDIELDLSISAPADATSFTVGIFDGDGRGLDLLSVPHWDTGVLSTYEYTLYADPNANGTGTTVIDLQPGSPSILSTAMPDNAWIDFTIPTGPEAATPGGNYFYRLKIKLLTPALTSVNAFKVRTTAVISGVTLDPTAQPFSYIANATSLPDIQIVYPNYPSLTPTNYDGSFTFYFDVPVSQPELTLWDGDYDRGKFNGTDLDTDDPDTPGFPFLPPWATDDALPEGVALGLVGTTGNPPDDRSGAATGIYLLKEPSVDYTLFFPDGQSYYNPNPSGNQEWEQFRIVNGPFNPTQMDYSTFEIPPGTYELRANGVDMQNLNALLLPFRVLCVDEEGVPCDPLRPYKIGDTVFADENGNGVQDPGEPGIEGVSIVLRDANGVFIEATTTDENGEYFFFVEAYSYIVEIDPENFSSENGTLTGFDPTTPDVCTAEITNDNYLDCDFGYRPPARIGDRVWLDFNADGIQDPDEPGLNYVSVELLDSDGNVVSSETTGGDGNYTFLSVQPGTYTVRVDASFLPGGLDPTFDRDGIATPHEASVTVTGGQTVFDVDFGYRGTGSLGDRLWLDANGNGAQDPGEGGLNGVTVRLFDFEGNPFATTVTAGDGNYTFTSLFEANYTVQVDASTLPAGLTATYDYDGVATLNTVELTLNAGENQTEIDFGYRGDASVGDRVWNDANADGIQDPGEAGLNGVTVQLLDGAANVVGTVVTAGDGNYSFSNLAAGTYTVRVDASTLPAGAAPTFDADGIATPNVTAVTLAAGTNRTDVDFGYRSGSSLGDRLWYDLDGDGIQEAGEGGINGVTVQLLDGAANVLATAVTSGDGEYTFPNLAAGTYTVSVDASTLPAGLAPTYDLDGIGTPNTATVTMSGVNRTDVDFGYRGNGSIGDRLWADANADGIQDPGENGINGVTVELLDNAANVLATTTTSGDGNYTFENLLGGEYRVRVIASSLPAGLAPSYDLDGVATANTTAVTLATGDARTDVDFGYRGTAALGDRLWYDANGNGTQDAGENGLNGVTVELLDSTANVILTTTTSGDGNYNFNNLLADTYTVRVVASSLPAGLAPTYDLDGIATANTASVTLAAGTTRDDVDFGYRGTASIGDRLWNDVNGNGTQDAGETGINGVTVELLDSAANVVGTTTTSGDGNYGFDNLETGTYTVRVVASSLPAGVAPTYDLDGIATANTASVTLTAGASRDDVDFGYRGTASLGDRLWYDANGNGIQDAGENGLNGVTVELLSGADVVATTTTSGDGTYGFANLGAGTYTVRVVASSLPAGLAPTYDLDGIATANTAAVTLTAGANRDDVDFGYRGTASLGDRLWYDANGNGTQDAGENGLNGVTVELLSGTDVVATTTTSGDGIYGFANLAAGNYTVRVVASSLPAGLAPTYDLDGIATANTAAVTLAAGATRDDVDFGYRGTASLGDRLWYDANGNGIQDAGENGLNGVTVELLSGADVVATTTTSGDGIYGFANLGAGNYTVRVVASSLPAGLAPTYDLDGIATANTASVTLTAGASRDDVDFGYRGTASLGDRLWYDANGNGIQDAGENGLNGVTVELLSGADVVATTTTSGDGIYGFANLGAGNYTVRVVASSLPAGLAPTYDLDGIATANTASVTLTAGATRNDVDFGYRGTASIGDRLWNDANGNGVQDAGENGLNGVTVQLVDGGGNVIASTTTSGDGNYGFNNLGAGNYTVRVVAATLPAGFTTTFDLDGTGTPNQATFTLAAGAARSDVDFGYQGAPSALGDRVWNDQDGDGVQDAGEAGINGVTVQLLNAANVVVATTTTSGDGNYAFTNLTSGTYTVRVDTATLPANVAPTFDADGTGTAHQATVVLPAGVTRSDVDFGYKGSAALRPILECVAPNSNGTWTAFFGYKNDNVLPVTILVGTRNQFSPAPADRGQPTTFAPGRTPFWPDAAFNVAFDGNNLVWSLDGRTSTANRNSTPCSNHVFVEKKWLGEEGNELPGPPSDLPSTFKITATSSLGTAICTYPAGSTQLSCVYQNNQPPALDNNGLWVPIGTSYTVTETGLPPGGAPLAGTGTFTAPNQFCVPGRDGLKKYCTHTVQNSYSPATASIGDRLWNDTDGDGAQDAGEAGLTGVTVELVNSGGTVVTTTTTGANGIYTFSNLAAGSYTVRVVSSTLPAGVAPTFDLDGVATANTAAVTLTVGQNRTDVDFGYRGNLSVGDRVWNDADGDGVQDAGETGLTGVTVELVNSGGTVIATTTTGANGIYTFNNLAAGTYTVRVVASSLPAGYAQTYDLDGVATANAATFTLNANRTDVDFGYRGNGSIGDRLWNDADGDGVQDAGEAGLTGVTVELVNSGGTVIATTTTGANGIYAFNNLAAGSYTVRVVSASLPAGVAPTFDLDGTATANTAAVTLTAGQNRTDVDFGYRVPPVTCTPGYFKDHFNTASFSNNDGTLSWAGAWIESDTAGAGVNSGNVTVGNPVSGYLILRDSPDTGTQPSAARQANLTGFASATLSFDFHVRETDPDDAAVIEVSNNGGASYTVLETLTGFTGNQTGSRTYNISSYISSNTRIRFRISNNYGASDEYFKIDWVKIDGTCTPPPATGSIGNRVWLDTDGDGAQDSGEAGINGVNVQLLNGSGTVIATATTAGDGNYTFSGLAAGSYSVRIVTSTLPAGAVQTYDLDGTGTAHVAAVTLTTGQNRTDADFGYRIPPASCTAGYFKDHFNSASFSNNDGTLSWAGAWIESDSAGAGVNSGNVTVGNPVSGYLILNDSPDTGTQPSAARQANLTGFVAATLSFDFHVRAADTDDAAVIEISKDGGATYTVLETFTNLTGNQTGSRSYNISSYIASNTRIRFRISKNYGADDEYFKIDWVKIDGTCPTTTTAPGTGTIGYWKTHPESWPVQTITVGGRSYTKDQAIDWMETPSRGDKTIDLFKQLVAAKLNVLVGNASSCISSTISSADSWLVSNPLGSNVRSSSSAWATGGPLHETLDDYNNGLLCAPHRD